MNFWPGFVPGNIPDRLPELVEAADWVVVDDPLEADLLLYGCHVQGHKTWTPKDPLGGAPGGPVRLFYTAENNRPDFRECDYAVTFARDVIDPRHLRIPNYVAALRIQGLGADVLARPLPTPEAAAAARAAKTGFCAYVQGHRVPFREDFVKKLARYKEVTCAGPSLNNTGYHVSRRDKYGLFQRMKFAVTFENEQCLGYVTEKLPDALAVNTIPIYWGDPSVALEFDPRSFIHVSTAADVDRAIERVIDLDQDDAAYDAMLQAPRLVEGWPRCGVDPQETKHFFARLVRDVRARAAARGRSNVASRKPIPAAMPGA